MAKRKLRHQSLLTGAMRHAAESLKSIIKLQRIPAGAARALLKIVKRGPAEGEAQGMMLALTTRDKSVRPLAHVVAEGPIAGRMPRPPGAPLPAPKPARQGFTRAADPSTSFEPLPGELQSLLETKKITQRSQEAARRLGFEQNDKGSALESVYRFLYSTLYRQGAARRKPKTPAKGKKGAPPPTEPPPEHAGMFANIFSPLTEFVLNQNPSLLRTERDAIDLALQAMAKADNTLKVATYSGAPQPPRSLFAGPNVPDAMSMLRTRRVAEGVLDVEMFSVRDHTGKTGRLVTDRLRGLLDVRKEPFEFTIVAIGEAKAQSQSGKIIGQVVQDVERLVAGLRTADGAAATHTFGPAQVKFGPRLVVAVLSEKAPPGSHVASLEGRLNAAFKTAGRSVPQIRRAPLDVGSTFADARTIAGEFQSALNELALGPKKN